MVGVYQTPQSSPRAKLRFAGNVAWLQVRRTAEKANTVVPSSANAAVPSADTWEMAAAVGRSVHWPVKESIALTRPLWASTPTWRVTVTSAFGAMERVVQSPTKPLKACSAPLSATSSTESLLLAAPLVRTAAGETLSGANRPV